MRRCSRYLRTRGFENQDGSVVITAMMFIMIFLILGVGLYFLISSQTDSTEHERTDVKAFNVAEAGIDAGMLALKLDWPYNPPPAAQASVDNETLKSVIKSGTSGLWDPTRSSPDEFIQVQIYDNVDASGNTTTIPYPAAPRWDSNEDGRMFVDSTANVDNNRHRILVLAERHQWQLTFVPGLALFANEVSSNGQGVTIGVENPNPAPHVPYAFYDVRDVLRKGIREGYAIAPTGSPTTFENLLNSALKAALLGIAHDQGTYFETAAAANTFLATGGANGKVVYIKANTAVEITGRTQIGTVREPTIVVIETPDGTVNGWDLRGTADFYGVLVTFGNNVLRGTSGVHGALYVSGTLENKGTGASGEINYNQDVLNNLNRQFVMSVNIVPNTWEEYTLPRSAANVTPGEG